MDIFIVNHGDIVLLKIDPGPGKGGKTVPSHEPKLGYNGMIARKGGSEPSRDAPVLIQNVHALAASRNIQTTLPKCPVYGTFTYL